MSIFVSIACLLDPDIVNTVQDCFEKAHFPDKVTVGICYQKDCQKPDLLKPVEKLYGKKVRVLRKDWKLSQGPMPARNAILSLIQNETYFFQIDCHTRFFQNWDTILLEQYRLCSQKSLRPVISYYPININNMSKPEMLQEIYHIATFRQIDHHGVKTSGRRIKVPDSPVKSFGISAAMLFMTTQAVLDNPIDPNLPFALHSGEQLLYSVRLWTRGYDFFTPSRHIIATEYITNRDRIDQSYRSYLNRNASSHQEPVWKKVKYLLGLEKGDYQVDPIWREGQDRSLKDYYVMTGIYKDLIKIFPDNRL